MTTRQVDVERIVAEVLARLRAAGGYREASATAADAGDSRSCHCCNGDGRTSHAMPEAAGPGSAREESPRAGREVVLPGRLITLAELEGRTAGATALRLMPSAVITPAARDRLRELDIAVRFDVGQAAPCPVVLAEADAAIDSRGLTAMLGREGIPVKRLAASSLARSIDALTAEVARGESLGVLLTAWAVPAACAANRRRGVRAIAAGRSDEALRAHRAAGANLLVLEAGRMSLLELKRTLVQCAAAGLRECPAGFRELLS